MYASHSRVQKAQSTRAQSEEPRVEENPRTEGNRVEKGQISRPVSPPGSTKTPRAQGLMSAIGEAEQPTRSGTMESVEVP